MQRTGPSSSSVPLPRRSVLALLAGAGVSTWAAGCATHPREGREVSLETKPFLAHVRAGNRVAVERALDADARLLRATDDVGRSAHVLAHLHGHPAIAELLQERGLELDVVEAVLATDWERVEALAAANPAAMNRAHPIGGNPLYASALTGGGEQYRLRSLGCDSNGRPAGGTGFTPARAAMDCRDPLGAWLAATDVLSNGSDPNAPQARGDSVLHGAVRARDERLVRLVLRKGGRADATDERGRTPLALARELEWGEGVALLENEASLPRDHRASQFAFTASREPFELDPLDDVPQERQSEITGVSHFNPKRVTELLAEDARLVHSISTDDELAIEACGHTGQREVIRIHLDHGAPLSLPTAISLGDLDHARWLLQRDPRLIHERGPHDFPLMWYPAIGGGSVEAAELLLSHGADLEQESGGETALFRAAFQGRVDLAAFLVERGADLAVVGYRQQRDGRTPLAIARDRGHEAVARLLADSGGPS